jgi:hypothetical protein
MRMLAFLAMLFFATIPAHPSEPCTVIHGRAHLYNGDGQLRIWHIGTHHEYTPEDSSWPRVTKWLEEGVKDIDKHNYVSPASAFYLYADFLVCPVEPFRKGSVQRAVIRSATHRQYVRVK